MWRLKELFKGAVLALVGILTFLWAQSVLPAVLPENESRLSLLLHGDWQQHPQEVSLIGWFQNHPQLKQVRCELYLRSNTDTILPCVRLQRSDGWVAYQASGPNIPNTADELCAGLFNKNGPVYLLPWRKPKPRPNVVPTPEPTPDLPDTPGIEPSPLRVSPRDVQSVPIADTVKAKSDSDQSPSGISRWMYGGGSFTLFLFLTLAANLRKVFFK